jgi:subtilisin family serine protease
MQDGTGVTVYILDTGINLSHVDFGGRAVTGIDEITPGGDASDCVGHGTHVAGIAGGAQYGVAKNVRLVSVRVLDCSGHGLESEIIAGVDWVTANHVSPAVANMSLGGPTVDNALDQAVQSSIGSGVTYVVSAGNCGADPTHSYCVQGPSDACTWSPSSARGAIVVGATDSTDRFAFFSNYGSCVTLNAPGMTITSDYIGSTTATKVDTGTSMAAPHVAGAAAVYLSANPSATPDEVSRALTSAATQGVLSGVPASTMNSLLYLTISKPLTLQATGPTVIADGRTCTWSAQVTGGTPPYGYQWQETQHNTLSPQSGWSQTYMANDFNSSYGYTQVVVSVWDANNGSATYVFEVQHNPPGGSYDQTYCH